MFYFFIRELVLMLLLHQLISGRPVLQTFSKKYTLTWKLLTVVKQALKANIDLFHLLKFLGLTCQQSALFIWKCLYFFEIPFHSPVGLLNSWLLFHLFTTWLQTSTAVGCWVSRVQGILFSVVAKSVCLLWLKLKCCCGNTNILI